MCAGCVDGACMWPVHRIYCHRHWLLWLLAYICYINLCTHTIDRQDWKYNESVLRAQYSLRVHIFHVWHIPIMYSQSVHRVYAQHTGTRMVRWLTSRSRISFITALAFRITVKTRYIMPLTHTTHSSHMLALVRYIHTIAERTFLIKWNFLLKNIRYTCSIYNLDGIQHAQRAHNPNTIHDTIQ